MSNQPTILVKEAFFPLVYNKKVQTHVTKKSDDFVSITTKYEIKVKVNNVGSTVFNTLTLETTKNLSFNDGHNIRCLIPSMNCFAPNLFIRSPANQPIKIHKTWIYPDVIVVRHHRWNEPVLNFSNKILGFDTKENVAAIFSLAGANDKTKPGDFSLDSGTIMFRGKIYKRMITWNFMKIRCLSMRTEIDGVRYYEILCPKLYALPIGRYEVLRCIFDINVEKNFI